MLALDTTTLRVVLAVLTVLTTALLLAAAAGNRSGRELRWWAAGNVTLCVGVAIGALPGVPLLVHGVLGYGVIGAGLGFAYTGLCVFVGAPVSLRPALVLGLLAMLGPLWFAYVTPDLDGRVRSASLVVVLGCVACGLRLLRWPGREGAVAVWVTAGGFLTVALALLLLLLAQMLHLAGDAGATRTSWNLLVNVIGQVAIFFGLVTMLEHRRSLELERLSMTEPLTGLLNRAGLQQAAQRRLARARRDRSEWRRAAVLLYDVDHFKRINDQHGHAAGDAVLQALARLSTGLLRPGDVLARYGGEEFVAVLPGVDAGAALQAAERLRSAIEAAHFEHAGQPIAVTVSVGVAAATDDEPRLDALIDAADRALYAAKAAGRNRVVDGTATPAAPAGALA